MFNNQNIQDELETLQDEVQQHNTFYPKTLRLSSTTTNNSNFPTTGTNDYFHPRRNSCSDSLRLRLRSSSSSSNNNSTKVKKTSDEQIQILPITRTGSIIQKRSIIRTKSLERKPREYLNQHRKSSSYNGISSDTLYNSDPRHSIGFDSHIPIERTVLSVLAPSNRSRKCSQTGKSGTETPISRTTHGHGHDSERSSSSSSNSPQSTLATSINSNETPTRPRYQPKPLLLSAFGTSKLHYHNNNNTNTPVDQIESISTPQQRLHSITSKNLDHDGLTNRLISLDRAQKIRQEKLLAHQAKKLQRRIREAELKAISSSSNRTRTRSIPEADEDQDCWCWLSCSDAEDGSQQEGGGGGRDEDDDAEEIAVVWRASLDVGRRVSKDRKALGRGHGIRPPTTKDSHISTIQTRPCGNSNTNNTWPLMFRIQSLMPHHLIKLIWQSRSRWFAKRFKTSTSAPFLFGSGLMSGLVLSATLFYKLPSFLQQRLWPISSEGIGFFCNLIFPNVHSHLYSSPIHFSIGTSLGLYSQW